MFNAVVTLSCVPITPNSVPVAVNDCYTAITNELTSAMMECERLMNWMGVVFIIIGVSCFC